MNTNTVLVFKDSEDAAHLTWYVNPQGKIVASTSFLQMLWCDSQVLNHTQLKAGDTVRVKRRDGQIIKIKCPLSAVQSADDYQQSQTESHTHV